MDISTIHQLPALPETAGELKEIANSLGAGRERVSRRATEAQVKSLDLKTNVVASPHMGLLPETQRVQRTCSF